MRYKLASPPHPILRPDGTGYSSDCYISSTISLELDDASQLDHVLSGQIELECPPIQDALDRGNAVAGVWVVSLGCFHQVWVEAQRASQVSHCWEVQARFSKDLRYRNVEAFPQVLAIKDIQLMGDGYFTSYFASQDVYDVSRGMQLACVPGRVLSILESDDNQLTSHESLLKLHAREDVEPGSWRLDADPTEPFAHLCVHPDDYFITNQFRQDSQQASARLNGLYLPALIRLLDVFIECTQDGVPELEDANWVGGLATALMRNGIQVTPGHVHDAPPFLHSAWPNGGNSEHAAQKLLAMPFTSFTRAYVPDAD